MIKDNIEESLVRIINFRWFCKAEKNRIARFELRQSGRGRGPSRRGKGA